MPPENLLADLENALNVLEESNLACRTRQTHYQDVHRVLVVCGNINTELASRILCVCVNDLNEYSSYTLTVIAEIVKKIKTGQCSSSVNLVPSAIGILNILKSLLKKKMDELRNLACNIFVMLPNEVIIHVAVQHFGLISGLMSQTDTGFPNQVYNIILKVLKVLPPDIKHEIVSKELGFWFSRLIPSATGILARGSDLNDVVMETLENLTEAVVEVNYSNHKSWLDILECISKPAGYPAVVKSLLEKQSEYWHRLWIVFIKLLKSQITQVQSRANASPINSLLPTVENAFKMDVVSRCRAFECWNVLIDNFASETKELVIYKRVKLLVIPLLSNNAKVEKTAVAKFNTWWHLLQRYQMNMDKFEDTMLVPFLHFCFGKANSKGCSPGQLSEPLKNLCAQAFIEIFGHIECDGCTAIPKLSNKLLNTRFLTSNWEDIKHSMTKVLLFLFNCSDITLIIQHLSCLFKSLLATLSELPDNTIRRDLFDYTLNIWITQAKNYSNKPVISNIMYDIILPTLTDGEFKKLLKFKDRELDNMSNFLELITELTESRTTSQTVQLLKPLLLKWIADTNLNDFLQFIMSNILKDKRCWPLWAAVTESTYDSNCTKENAQILLSWPLTTESLKNIPKPISDTHYSACLWTNLFNLYPNQSKMFFDDELFQSLENSDLSYSINFFVLTISLTVLKRKLVKSGKTECERETELIESIVLKVKDFQYIEQILPTLMDVAVLMLNNIIEEEDKSFAITVISIVSSILKLIIRLFENKQENWGFTVFMQNLLTLIESVFNKECYYDMKKIIMDDLITCYTKFTYLPIEKNATASILKLFLTQYKGNDVYYNKLKSLLEPANVRNNVKTTTTPLKADKKFVAPEKKPQKKKKEPSIVNKVVEDGEEYVVVKSNWKFNPKNLTENQKEKFRRKREDIPALYQDLSQSQDEFKLSTWKTDSQDTSTTNSKSASKTNDGDATFILKNIASSDVVPKIIENLMSETKDTMEVRPESPISSVEKKKTADSPASKSKTPRMALKDRVFRNVRNLMEKSSLQKNATENKPNDESASAIENTVPRTPNARVMSMMHLVSASASKAVPEKQSDVNVKTPVNKHQNTAENINSAPATILTERPSRIKRKPKKFDDVQLIDIKKRRHSVTSYNDSQSENDISANLKEDEAVDALKMNALEIPSSTEPTTSTEVTSVEKQIVDISIPESVVDLAHESVSQKNVTSPTKDIQSLINQNVSKITQVVEEPPAVLDKNDHIIPETPVDASLNQSKSLLIKAKTKNQIELTEEKNQEPINNKNDNNSQHSQLDNDIQEFQSQHELLETPKVTQLVEKSCSKQPSSRKKKSRIEKELAIDMAEGYLNSPSEKRARKKITEIITPRRKYVKKDKSNTENSSPNSTNKSKNKETDSPQKVDTMTIIETQVTTLSNDEAPCSEDVIESSQDSSVTSISMKSTRSVMKIPFVSLEKHRLSDELINNTQSLLDNFDNNALENKTSSKNDSKNDSIIPHNTTAIPDKTADVTATKDTEPNEDISNSSDVIIISEDIPPPVTLNTDEICIDLNTQEIANADTQTMDPNMFNTPNLDINKNNDATISLNTQEDVTKTFIENLHDDDSASSPLKNKSQRKKDFLNNTFEISPIKIQSPLRDEKTPSPETSNDFVVIKLTSPVNSKGEPFDKCDSPEIFTEDKVSPDKRDVSPPREGVINNHSSPSSSLSLKKNRPQVRSGGRAAHMLGLCVPEDQKSLNVAKPVDVSEDSKKSSASTPVRRNLRMMYSTTDNNADNNAVNMDDSDESENFLKFKKTLPPVDSSPAVPILKRKLAEIADDVTISPASKRKRVSFHDPPVSTTVSVRKYIEPAATRSPSNSAIKRQERQTRSVSNMKSPKRLDNVFKLDTVLVKTVESFSENDTSITSTDETEMSSIDQTPVVEIVKISDLNDTDPICPDLVHCKDPISNIASDLSSPAMSALLTKELEGKVECIGDLAKMTEVEVNRLCIKVPKVAVARKVLGDYLSKKPSEPEKIDEIDLVSNDKSFVDVDTQTNIVNFNDNEVQTNIVYTATASVQCEVSLTSISSQTEESGSKSTKETINSIKEKPDFVDSLIDTLDDTCKTHIAMTLPLDSISRLLLDKLVSTKCKQNLDQSIEKESTLTSDESTGKVQLSEKFETKDLVFFCCDLLKKAYE